MFGFIEIVYYSLIVLCLIYYFGSRKKGLSVTDFLVIETTLMFSVAGPLISRGIIVGGTNLDGRLLLLYLINGTVIIFGFVFGKKITVKRIKLQKNNVSDGVLIFCIICIIIYTIGFFVIIRDNIPLLKLLQGYSSSEVKIARLQTTHNFAQNYNTFFIYRYRNLVFNYLTLYVFSIIFVKQLQNKAKYGVLFAVYLPFVFLTQFYAVEKASMIYLLMIIVFDYYLYKNKSSLLSNDKKVQNKGEKRRFVMFSIIGSCAFVVLYTVFMGVDTYSAGLKSMLNRAFLEQSSSTFLQKRILDSTYNGCLRGAGVPLTIIDALTRRSTVKLSKDVYSVLYSSYATAGGAGSAGTFPAFYLYSNFGLILTIIIVFCFSAFTGYYDLKTTISIKESESCEIPIAFKSMVLILFFQAYMSTYGAMMSFPFLISPEFLFVMLLTVFFQCTVIGGSR